MANNKDLILEIKANTTQAKKQIEELRAEIKNFSNGVNNSTSTLKQNEEGLHSLTSSVKSLVGAYAGFSVLKSVVETTANFESSMKRLGAVSQASATDLAQMESKAKSLGATTQYSASQVSEAMNYEAMAGMKTNDILTATKSTLDLATVGNMDLARASDIATDSMSGFGLKAKDLIRVTDVMSATITNSNTNVEQLGEAYKQVAPVAKNLGLSIEQTSAMLGVLANAGRKGGEAGTHLKIILQRLASTTKPVTKAFKELGLNAYDSTGKLKPLGETLKAIKAKLKGLSDQKRNDILRNLFGEEAISSANIILGNLDSMDGLLKKVSNSNGQASKMAKEFNDSLKGAYLELKSSLEALALSIGDDLLPALTEMTHNLTSIVRGTKEFYDENSTLIKTLTELAGAMYAVGKLKSLMSAVMGIEALAGVVSFAKGVGTLSEAFAVLKTEMMALSIANPIFLGLAVVIGGVTYELNKMQESIDKLNKSTAGFNDVSKNQDEVFQDLAKHLDKTNQKFVMTQEHYDGLKKKIKNQIEALKKQIEATKNASDGSVQYKEQIAQLKRQQDNLVNAGKALTNQVKIVTKETNKSTEANKDLKESQNDLININSKLGKSMAKEYEGRVKTHTAMIENIKAKEIGLAKKIEDINKALIKKLKLLEDDRLNAIENINDKIHGINIEDAKSYEKYTDTKKQADILLAKAKEEIRKGDLAQAKIHMQKYEALVVASAQKEKSVIKKATTDKANALKKLAELRKQQEALYLKEREANYKRDYAKAKEYKLKENALSKKITELEEISTKDLGITKEEVNKNEIKGLKSLKSLTNDYYKTAKEQARKTANEKLAQLKAQMQATKAQLQLEVQRLELEKQLVQALTGKKLNIDVSGAKSAIKSIDGQIKELNSKVKEKKYLKVDTTSAVQSINSVQATYGSLRINDITLKVNANTTPADFGIDKLITTQNGRNVVIKVNPEYTKAKEKLDRAIKGFEHKTVVSKVDANTSEANRKTKEYQQKAKQTLTSKVNANTSEATHKIDELRSFARGSVSFKVIAHTANAQRAINALKVPTSSTHTVYIKEVHTRANGGMIPIRRADGGSTDFQRKEGRIAGYDPTDSDDVPALLTRGEFVIKRDAVSHYGDDFLYKINNKKLPKYAKGGAVCGDVNLADEPDVENLVDNLKDKIEKKFESINIPIDKIKGFEKSSDVYRLEKFYKKIEKIKKYNPPKTHRVYETGLNPYNRFMPHTIVKVVPYTDKEKQRFIRTYIHNKIPKFQSGGKLNGYGGGDRNLALLEDGEFIMRKEAVAHLGDDTLHKLNNMQISLPKFQTGGLNGTALKTNNSSNGNMDINFKMPSGNSYKMNSSEEVANLLSQELRRLL